MKFARLFILALTVEGIACSSDQTTSPAPAPTPAPTPAPVPTQPPPVTPPTPARLVTRTDIVSDEAGAVAVDPVLKNAWGLSFNPVGFAWVSATESGVSAVYGVTGNQPIPAVTIPKPGCSTDDHSSPTGQVYNGAAGSFMGDTFVFVTEQGTIAGWQLPFGAAAQTRVETAACTAIYKGVTILNYPSGNSRLYATNFHDAKVEVFDGNYNPVTTTGTFVDPNIPAGYAPFNIEQIDGRLLVTYAKQDDNKKDDVKGPGNGYVDMFDSGGVLVSRLITAGELNAPWGIAKTPADFGTMPNRLLVGNFGDGMINVYALDASTGLSNLRHEGTVVGSDGNPMVIDGLWALRFGPDTGGFHSNVLYFTSGPANEEHGRFGMLEAPAAIP